MRVLRQTFMAVALSSLAVASCGGSTTATPQSTINNFLHAAAAGDSTTACGLLSATAQQQMVQGMSCAQGMKMTSAVYGRVLKQVTITDVTTQDATASGVARLNGKPMVTFRMIKSSGKWIIDSERPASTTTPGTTAQSSGPSPTRVDAISSCLAKAGAPAENPGPDTTGGYPHTALGVTVNHLTVAEFDVFASASAAGSAYQAIKSSPASPDKTRRRLDHRLPEARVCPEPNGDRIVRLRLPPAAAAGALTPGSLAARTPRRGESTIAVPHARGRSPLLRHLGLADHPRLDLLLSRFGHPLAARHPARTRRRAPPDRRAPRRRAPGTPNASAIRSRSSKGLRVAAGPRDQGSSSLT